MTTGHCTDAPNSAPSWNLTLPLDYRLPAWSDPWGYGLLPAPPPG